MKEAAELSASQVRGMRLEAQRLREPAGRERLLEVAGSVVGVNAQRTSAMMLALRARARGLEADDVREAIAAKRLVRTWAMRGTIHLMQTDDLGLVMPLLAPRLTRTVKRRQAELGLSEERLARGLEEIRAALSGTGPLTRWEIYEKIVARGFEIERQSQALIHLVRHAALTGLVCLGPDRGNGEMTYVLLDEWLGRSGKEPAAAGRTGLAALALRYLAGFGPASPADFAAWSGLTASDANRAFKMAGEAGWLAEMRVAGRKLFVTVEPEPAGENAAPKTLTARLLPAFDDFLLGYRDRDLLVAPEHRGNVFHGGQTVPAVLLDGVVAGTWRHERRGKRLLIAVSPFGRLSREATVLIGEEAEDVGRFLGYPVSLEVV